MEQKEDMIEKIEKLNNMNNINIDVNSKEGKMLIEVVEKHSTIEKEK